MNNIFLPNDPLLFNQSPQYLQQEFQQKMEQKYNDYIMRNMQAIPDKLFELDEKMKSLSPEIVTILNDDVEFNELSTQLQSNIQNELISLISYFDVCLCGIVQEPLKIKNDQSCCRLKFHFY